MWPQKRAILSSFGLSLFARAQRMKTLIGGTFAANQRTGHSAHFAYIGSFASKNKVPWTGAASAFEAPDPPAAM